MNELLLIGFFVLLFLVFWLLPLYWVCKWAEKQRKNYRMVGLVGILTGWLVALILALLLPQLSDEAFAQLTVKTQREPMGQEGVVFAALGIMSSVTLGFIAWMKWMV